MDVKIEDGEVREYRTRLQLSFKYERSLRAHEPSYLESITWSLPECQPEAPNDSNGASYPGRKQAVSQAPSAAVSSK